MTCTTCGHTLTLPLDLTAVYVACSQCGARNVLPPELIQARQRQLDFQALAAARAQEFEQRQHIQERILAHRKAASRRSTTILLVVLGILVLLPVAIVGSLFAFGVAFGKKAIRSFEQAQDPKRNGMPAVMGEIRVKQSEGCNSVLLGPEIRFGSAGAVQLPLEENGPCVHLLGATAAPSRLTLEQASNYSLALALPPPSSSFDYRLCPTTNGIYAFRITAEGNEPYTIAAVACPRTSAEGLVRTNVADPASTGLTELRSWSETLLARGCRYTQDAAAAFQDTQLFEIDAAKGRCFELLALSHFPDAPLTVTLTAPSGRVLAKPTPAVRVQLEYCPTVAGRHRVEIVPATRDHYSVATLDCPRK